MPGRTVLIASAVVSFLVVGGLVVAVTQPETAVTSRDATDCVGDVDGARLDPVVADSGVERVGRQYERTVEFAIDVGDLAAGKLLACTAVGDVEVVPSSGGRADVTFTITSEKEEAVAATRVLASFAASGGALNVAAAPLEIGVRKGLFEREGAAVEITVRVPAAGAWALDASTDVGDLDVHGLLLGATRARTDVGDVTLAGVDLAGDLAVLTNVGDQDVRLASVAAGRIRLETDVGSIDLELPSRADVGYDVLAEADVGDARVDIGPTDRMEESADDGPSSRVEARSAGYDARPTKVGVGARADVGDVHVAARGAEDP